MATRLYLLLLMLTFSASLPARQPLQQFGQGLGPYAAAVAPNEETFLTGGELGAFLWDMETGEVLRSFVGHSEGISIINYSPSGNSFVSGSYDRTARVWNLDSGELLNEFHHQAHVRDAQFSPAGDFLVTTSGNTAFFWDLELGTKMRELPGPNLLNHVAFSPDGTYFAMAQDSVPNHL